MSEWKSEQEVFDLADRAARKIVELASSEGIDHSPGSPDITGSGGWAIARGMRQDASDVLSLDPQKIIDEFERMQKVCRAMSPEKSSDIIDAFRTIDYSVQDWRGDGAKAFQHQVSLIQAFIGQQYDYLLATGDALVMLLGVSTQVRRDYCALATATVAAAQKAMDQDQEADTKFAIQVGTSLATALVGVATGGAWLTASAGLVISTTGTALQRAIEGDKSEEVAGGYVKARNELLQNYKDLLGNAKDRIVRAHTELSQEKNELFTPIPPSIDVTAPNFRYQNFYSADRDLEQFGSRVDAEHKKVISVQRPDGVLNPGSRIQQRLEN